MLSTSLNKTFPSFLPFVFTQMVLGAVVGVAAGQVIGALWYSQLLFGAVWMKHAYPQQTKKLEFTVSTLGIAFAGQATMALLLSYIMP